MCDRLMPPIDRRALLVAGALSGVATSAALVDVAPAAAGSSRTLRFSGHFRPGGPDWHYLPFRVPRGVRAIEVSYDYARRDTGAGFSTNVVDIGIFDPSGHSLGNAAGFRGWSGGARRSFRLSSSSATPGYLAGPITPGVWRVILGPFLVLPPGVSWEVRVTLRFGRPGPAFMPHPPPRRVAGTGPGWYRGDLHTHTVHSDGTHSQQSLARLAREAGLDFIGSSEHNTSSATLTWGRHAPDDLLVLCGEEVTTRAGHWIGMGLPPGTWLDWRYRGDRALARFTRLVRRLGGLSFACHPWVPIPGTKWDLDPDYSALDAVEIWNGPWTLDDQFGVEHWHGLLTSGTFVPVVGCSDSHRPDQTVGEAQTVAHAATLSSAAVVAALRRGRSWLAESADVGLSLTASTRGRSVACGEHLGAELGDVVDVLLAVSGTPGCLAQVIGPAGPIAAGVAGADGHVTVSTEVVAGTVPFVRAEVRRLDGAPVVDPLQGVPALPMVALTNPVFLS